MSGRALAFPLSSRGAKLGSFLGLVATVGTIVLAVACRPSAVRLGPETPLRSVEGYASLKFNGQPASGRSKVSFSILLPDRARIDVFDPLGRAIIILVFRPTESFFALVPEKAYWRGEPGEVLGKFLAFDISLTDLVELLAGRWGGGNAGDDKSAPGWVLTRDSRGRVVAAERRHVVFEVKDFFAGTAEPHLLTFSSDKNSGSLKVFDARFNAAPKESALEAPFLEGFASKTWPEMEELLRHEAEVVR